MARYLSADGNPEMKSKRTDGRGHWKLGRPRSPLTPAQVAACREKLLSALLSQSKRALARRLGVSDMAVARIASGEDTPSERTARLVEQLL